jgi:hypothetical protein
MIAQTSQSLPNNSRLLNERSWSAVHAARRETPQVFHCIRCDIVFIVSSRTACGRNEMNGEYQSTILPTIRGSASITAEARLIVASDDPFRPGVLE